jgi:hypothetical protein
MNTEAENKKFRAEMTRTMDLFAAASADAAEKLRLLWAQFERLLKDCIRVWLEAEMEKLRLEIYRQEIQGLWLI